MITITFQFTDIAAAAALLAKIDGTPAAVPATTAEVLAAQVLAAKEAALSPKSKKEVGPPAPPPLPTRAPSPQPAPAAPAAPPPLPTRVPSPQPAPAAATAPSQPTAEAAPSPAPAAPAPSTSAPAAAAPTAAPAAAPSAPAEITYQDLYKAVLTLHKLDPTAAVPIAKSLGADTFKLLQPQQWAEAHRLVSEAIAARS